MKSCLEELIFDDLSEYFAVEDDVDVDVDVDVLLLTYSNDLSLNMI